MKNEKGITLVELIAALGIVGIITVVIASVLMTGTSSADRTTSKQQLQQEANYIVEAIRAKYLEENMDMLIITATDNSISIKRDDGVEEIISDRYGYEINSSNEIDPTENEKFHLIIKDDGGTFEIETTFSKLR
ncbi:type II secretion system protein [Planococcus sp. X10-3]|uniref:type II secretion system protein n=1 Tax=Planococcus sp. X10-3 TaxID=3061240 RepID=UPI003BB159DE